jgi:hypothetical protein
MMEGIRVLGRITTAVAAQNSNRHRNIANIAPQALKILVPSPVAAVSRPVGPSSCLKRLEEFILSLRALLATLAPSADGRETRDKRAEKGNKRGRERKRHRDEKIGERSD